MTFRGDRAFKATQRALSVQRLGCKYSRVFCVIRRRNFVPPLSFKQCVWLYSSNSSLFSSILTVLSCLRSLQIVRQMSWFNSTLPSGWVSTTSPSVDLALVSTQEGGVGGGGRHMAVRSTKHVISTNRDEPRGWLLFWCDLLVSVQPWMALCAIARPGGEVEPQKRDCCGFREADGAVYQMGVWGANKLVNLEAGARTVNTASSRIWSTQMLAMIYCSPVNILMPVPNYHNLT